MKVKRCFTVQIVARLDEHDDFADMVQDALVQFSEALPERFVEMTDEEPVGRYVAKNECIGKTFAVAWKHEREVLSVPPPRRQPSGNTRAA